MATSDPLRYDTAIDLRAESTHTRVLSLVGQRQRVLELGCSTGQMTRVLKERGCQVVAIEADVEAAKRAEEHCEHMVVGDLEALDFDVELGERRFDVIIAADVLEHLKAPEMVLGRLRPFLAPGGYLVASVPNVAHGSVRLALLGGSFPYAETGLLDRTHLRFYNRESLTEMVSEGGFCPVHIDTVDLEIERSEVPFALGPEAQAFLDSLNTHPDALTYQFLVLAFPTTPPLGPVPLLLLELNRRIGEVVQAKAVESAVHEQWVRIAEAELIRHQGESEQLRATVAQLEAQVGALEASAQEKDRQLAALHERAQALGAAVEEHEAALRSIHASKLWRLGTLYRNVAQAFRKS